MKRIKQKRILFFSYVLTVLMCILIGYIVTGFSESVLKAQINETMFNAFSNTVTTLSHEIDSQQTNMYAILENKEVVSLSNKYSSYNRQEQRESVSKINDEMNIQFMNQDIAEEHYICFDNKDIVIGIDTVCDKETAYNEWFSEIYPTKEEWLDSIFSSKSFIDFVPFTDKNGTKKTAIIQKSIRNIGARPSSVAISFVNERRIFDSITDDGSHIILQHNGKTVFSNKGMYEYTDIEPNGSRVSIDGKRYIRYGMEKNGLYFIQLFSNESYTKKLNVIKTFGFVINLLIFIFGLMMAHYFTKINYRPLRRVMSRLRVDMSEENEYIAIEKSIENVINDHIDMTKRLRETDRRITEAGTRMLLSADSRNEIKSITESMQIKFAHRYFAVVVFILDDIGIIKGNDRQSKNDFEIAGFSVVNVFSELIPGGISCNWYMSGKDCMCILNFSRQDMLDDIYDASRDASAFMAESFKMEIKVFISSSGGLSELADMRREIDMLMKPAELIKDKSYFIFGDFGEYVTAIWEREYKNRLINGIETGNDEEIDNIISEFEELGIYELQDKDDMKKILYETIFSLYISVKGTQNNSSGLVALLNSYSFKEVRKELRESYKRLAGQAFGGDSDEMISNILKYIEENYKNVDLNVSYLSNIFNISISGLSRYFKNNMGEGLADYILKYRCNKAVEYIEQNPDMPINEIGEACGFYSTGSFIRAFKRIYGTTPGKYNKN